MSEDIKEALTVESDLLPQKRYDVFISYHRETGADVARCIEFWLRSKDISCFIDVQAIGPGLWRKHISNAIKNSEYFLIVVTKDALKSKNVRDEIEEARNNLKVEKIVPLMIDTDNGNRVPIECEWLNERQCFAIHRGESFEGDLEKMVEKAMPGFSGRLVTHISGGGPLLSSIRWYKNNDGQIDSNENAQIHAAAKEYGISENKVEGLIAQVVKECEEEQAFTKEVIQPYFEQGDKNVDSNEHNKLQREAESRGIKLDRLNELILAVRAKKDAMKLQEMEKLAKENATKIQAMKKRENDDAENLRNMVDEHKRAKRRWISLIFGILISSVCGIVLAWWQGRGAGDREASDRVVKEREELKIEITRAKQKVALAEEGVQKQVAAASLAREQAERDAKEVKAKLAAAQESVASSDAARKDAENRLAQVSAALETEQAEHAKDKKTIESQQKDILDMRVSEQAARKDAELKSVEKAAELERANEKIKELEADKSRLEKDLEQARERKRIEDDLNVL